MTTVRTDTDTAVTVNISDRSMEINNENSQHGHRSGCHNIIDVCKLSIKNTNSAIPANTSDKNQDIIY